MAEQVYYDVVRGDIVVLPDGAGLADGARVEIRPLSPATQSAETLSAEDLVKQDLLKAGLLSEIRAVDPLEPEEEIVPIHVRGKSLSESILEDRR